MVMNGKEIVIRIHLMAQGHEISAHENSNINVYLLSLLYGFPRFHFIPR
jgi:hypothetical protein